MRSRTPCLREAARQSESERLTNRVEPWLKTARQFTWCHGRKWKVERGAPWLLAGCWLGWLGTGRVGAADGLFSGACTAENSYAHPTRVEKRDGGGVQGDGWMGG
jgi:hypothetical protein